jgi:hypothetical protein
MIISASRRCDLPAYYADWLLGRIKAGYCLVRNPFDSGSHRRVSLGSEDMDFLVLWTRDPRPIAAHYPELERRGVRSYLQVTVTGYPGAIERGALPLPEALAAFRALAGQIGARRVLWRYDPVIVAEGLSADWHRRNFEGIAAALEGATERVTLSIIDEYAFTARRLAKAGYPGAIFGSPREGGSAALPAPYPELLADLAAIARARGMRPVACAEPFDLTKLGIERGACVDTGLASSLWGLADEGRGKAKGQRKDCGCAESVDIGAYSSCPRGCVYCYANRGRASLLTRGDADEEL